MGTAMLTIMAAFAQLERDTMIERTRAGLAAAAANNRHGGRPRKMDAAVAARARELKGEQRDWLLRSVGIVLECGDMDFRPPVFHDLRHTAVSLYLTVTKNVKHVQRIAGHKDGTTTINT